MLGDVFSSLTAAVGAADKVVELMQQHPGVPPHGALQPADFAGRVELEGVTFSYPARPEVPVLNGLSLKVNPGEVCLPVRALDDYIESDCLRSSYAARQCAVGSHKGSAHC